MWRPAEDGPGLLRFGWSGLTAEAPVHLLGRVQSTSAIPVSITGKEHPSTLQLAPMARMGLKLQLKDMFIDGLLVVAEYEHDLPTGVVTLADEVLDGEGLPQQLPLEWYNLRKLNLRVHLGPALFASFGAQTNHWGLGLVSNDGAHGWTPGSARFTDPRQGDRVLRAAVGTGPLTALKFGALVFADKVLDDDVQLMRQEYADPSLHGDDEAYQMGAAFFVGRDLDWGGGLYSALRGQVTPDGRTLWASIIDVTGRYSVKLMDDFLDVGVAGEAAVLAGMTNFVPNLVTDTPWILQYGGVLRAHANTPYGGGVVDVVWASGDQNLDDTVQSGFRADRNFEQGMLLYRQVLAAHTGYGVTSASDLTLIGEPAIGLERFPTRGAVSNTVAVFPRLWSRPLHGLIGAFSELEIYGGPLLAFSEVPLLDPLRTRVAGGKPTNALGGGGAGLNQFLGAEFDVGVRYPITLFSVHVAAGAEGAVFLPGPAFSYADGAIMAPVYGGRLMLEVRL